MAEPTTHAELSAFNDGWLDAWTRKDIAAIAAMYTEDCAFMDSATAQGLYGRAALVGSFERLFPLMPDWRYRSDELWAIPGGKRRVLYSPTYLAQTVGHETKYVRTYGHNPDLRKDTL